MGLGLHIRGDALALFLSTHVVMQPPTFIKSSYPCTGSPSDVILITIIDSGVDVRHPDLQGRLWRNPREVAGNGIDDDGNGTGVLGNCIWATHASAVAAASLLGAS